jgi:predicted nucleic acid-binding protein
VTVLDTDVLSGLMKPEPDLALGAWINRQPTGSIWTTAITIFEIRFGIDLLPTGRRKDQLELAFARTLKEDLRERVLDFDSDSAREAGAMAARRQLAGRPVEFHDMEIAGIVAVHRATLATRNTRHFENLGIEVVNPWARV